MGARLLHLLAALVIFASLVSIAAACRREPAEKDGLQVDETHGIVTITANETVQAGQVRVWVHEAGGEESMWFPSKFPARLSVAFGTRVQVTAEVTEFEPFREETAVSRDRPRRDVAIALAEARPRGLFGFRYSDLPKRTGLRPVSAATIGEPAGKLLRIRSFSGIEGRMLDDKGRLWSPRQRDAQQAPEYWLVGYVDEPDFRRIVSLAATAASTPLVESGGCNDCGGIAIWLGQRSPDGGITEVLLGSDGGRRARRTNPAADALLLWFLAVIREPTTPVP